MSPSTLCLCHGIRIETVNIHGVGDIRVAGYTTLDTIKIDSFFPYNTYSTAISSLVNPWDLVAQFKGWMDSQTVVRFIITGTDVNMPVLIEDIRTGERDGSNDVYFTLSLAEYRYVSVSRSATRSVSAATSRAVSVQPATPDTYTVVKGDTLRHIARAMYGDHKEYTKLATANSIKNPDLIFPGTVLTIPR